MDDCEVTVHHKLGWTFWKAAQLEVSDAELLIMTSVRVDNHSDNGKW